jgi:prolyl-tRNA editing enzyme YbaK/EbsC (Cys-tRNA(Pro) deacylase)
MSRSPSVQLVESALRAAGYTGAVRELAQSTRSAAEAAAAVGCELGRIVKSLVFRMASGAPLLVLTSGANRVNEAALSERLGAALARADAEFVRAHTGFAIGGVPPLGHPSPIRTVIDADLLEHPTVWAAAGTPNALFEISPSDLARMCRAEISPVV